MQRREFITVVGGAVTTWSLAALAQSATPVIGFLRSSSLADAANLVTAFRQGLKQAGFVEGQNVVIEFRSANDYPDRLQALLADLIHQPVAVIVVNGGAVLAAKAATTTVPIVFVGGDDPVRDGLVASFNRPAGNLTGVVFTAAGLGGKRLELLRRLVPKATTIGILMDLHGNSAERRDVQAAALAIQQPLIVLDVGSDRDIETAFATLVQRGAGALVVNTGAFLYSRREKLVALAARYELPTSYPLREFVAIGGLTSYGTSIADAYRQAGVYTGQIIKGEKTGELPVTQSSKFEFVINLKTAKTLGLEVPPNLLALADEAIE
ncbi:MAG TPA: ABC transporter substrate-binding protein [Bradyrhizobium sp.]|nr:ABC transporter substrate-binding protein [Bradyrhizobium sp.]